VKLAGRQEAFFARCTDAALTVSKHFQDWLSRHWRVQAHVLYDKAPSFFQPATATEVGHLPPCFSCCSSPAVLPLLFFPCCSSPAVLPMLFFPWAQPGCHVRAHSRGKQLEPAMSGAIHEPAGCHHLSANAAIQHLPGAGKLVAGYNRLALAVLATVVMCYIKEWSELGLLLRLVLGATGCSHAVVVSYTHVLWIHSVQRMRWAACMCSGSITRALSDLGPPHAGSRAVHGPQARATRKGSPAITAVCVRRLCRWLHPCDHGRPQRQDCVAAAAAALCGHQQHVLDSRRGL
jgi:hypothetical protein